MTRLAIVASAAALVGLSPGEPPASTPAAERITVRPASQAFAFLSDYYKMEPAQRSRFALTYRLHEGGRTTPGRLTLVDGESETPLPASPDGWLTRLPSAASLARGARVRQAVPADARPGVAMLPEALLPAPGEDVRVVDLSTAASQVDAATRRMAGPLSFVTPRFSRVLFSGAEGAAGVDAQGRATPLPLWHGTPVLDLAAPQGARTVRFAKAPYHALLAPPAK